MQYLGNNKHTNKHTFAARRRRRYDLCSLL
jgi:hypothetical protein